MGAQKSLTVVDLETTGLFARSGDRVVEIAALTLDAEGNVLEEYCTLVNPGRDIGATAIHGIEAWEVRDAPTFAEILGDVAWRLRDCIVVGHNVRFDLGFLGAEFARAGHALPDVQYLCTLRMAAALGGYVPCRKLEALCEYFGVPLPRGHSALHDARATAGLLKVFLQVSRPRSGLVRFLQTFAGEGVAWPDCRPSGRACARGQQRCPTELGADFISRLVARLRDCAGSSADVAEYLSFLDRVLEDRRVTPEEAEKLFEVAAVLGISRDQAEAAHLTYLRSLVSVALEDRTLSEFELRDLKVVAQLLCVSNDALQAMMERVREQAATAPSSASATGLGDDLAGRLICFTGKLRARLNGKEVEREFAERIARERGMLVKSGVSRKLDFLVAADPDSISEKARKAREYGTRIISEAQFWKMMGVQVE